MSVIRKYFVRKGSIPSTLALSAFKLNQAVITNVHVAGKSVEHHNTRSELIWGQIHNGGQIHNAV